MHNNSLSKAHTAKSKKTLMLVLHTAHFAYRQAFACGLQLSFANLFFFASLQTLGSAFVGGGHRAVAGDIFLAFFVAMFIRSKSHHAA
jgi:hypothetical protein